MASDVPYCVVLWVCFEELGGEVEDFEGVVAFSDLWGVSINTIEGLGRRWACLSPDEVLQVSIFLDLPLLLLVLLLRPLHTGCGAGNPMLCWHQPMNGIGGESSIRLPLFASYLRVDGVAGKRGRVWRISRISRISRLFRERARIGCDPSQSEVGGG